MAKNLGFGLLGAILALIICVFSFGVGNNRAYDPKAMTFNTPTRSLSTTGSNNTFTISNNRPATVCYSVNFSVALLAAISNGVVELDYSTNGGSTWVNACQSSQAFGVALTITTNQTQILYGTIPAGALVRINRVSNTNCTITLPANKQHETIW